MCKSLVWSNMAYLNCSCESEDDNNTRLKFETLFWVLVTSKRMLKISPSFFHEHFGIPSQYIRVANRLSPLSRCLYSWEGVLVVDSFKTVIPVRLSTYLDYLI